MKYVYIIEEEVPYEGTNIIHVASTFKKSYKWIEDNNRITDLNRSLFIKEYEVDASF